MITAYHAKYFAHELSRRHSSTDSEKLAGTLLDAQVDLNPHQLEAALFAFKSPLSKGAILADEVGLGKTIEAGLVLAQKWAEGKRRILIITPANLRKQWSQEMAEKFYLPTLILEAKNYNQLRKSGMNRPLEQPDAMILCSYQFAARHSDELMTTRWDIVVMDEAHRLRNVYRPDNRIGNALKIALANAPKLLLTATPLQNSLMELYGLVSLIDDYAFGDAKSFRARFARLSGNDSFEELKSRLQPLCHRTLRRQVLEYIRYTNRLPVTQEFVPSEQESALYEKVSEYLRRPTLHALPNSQRQLMTLILRKLLASSTFAIAGTLDSLVRKLRRQLNAENLPASGSRRDEIAIGDDFEEFDEYAEEWDEDAGDDTPDPDQRAAIMEEVAALEAFRDLAISITENAKGLALLKALDTGFAKAKELGSADKCIIFTESRRTQDYLVRLLTAHGHGEQLVLFNGSNNDSQSNAIYSEWLAKHQGSDHITGSRSADMRAALVNHFHDHARIMIATEAAAEGINLQFCSMVVNYDLPWNPQRIEQRIGRCHRYGQQHDVVVVNFLNRGNAADQRVFELLAEKFQLFSGVFGASDEVLGAIESGVEFEKRIIAIYQTCRTSAEIEAEFARLRAEMDAQISATMDDTRRKLLENFDAEVHDRLRVNLSESRAYLNKYETLLWALTQHELARHASFDNQALRFTLHSSEFTHLAAPGIYALSKDPGTAHRYRLGHPLAQALIAQAAGRELAAAELRFDYSGWAQKANTLESLLGQSGVMTVLKLAITGADSQDHLLLAAVNDSGESIDEASIRRCLDLPATACSIKPVAQPAALNTLITTRQQAIFDQLATQQTQWFEAEMDKLEGWAEDKRRGLKVELKDYDERIAELKKQARSAANLPTKLTLQRQLRELDRQRDDAWRSYDDAARAIENQKDTLLDQVEAQLQQQVVSTVLFTVRWAVT